MSAQQASHPVSRIIEDVTHGRPYVFVVMPYKSKWDFFVHLRDVVRDTVGLACIRADDVAGAGHDLLAKIHLLIERAELVMAEVSEKSPNVFYEVGYAVGIQKPLLLLIEQGAKVPTDLKGREVIEYAGSRMAMEVFDARLREHLRQRVNSQIALLRDMLEADVPRPTYIIASPKYPGERSRIHSHVYDQRTFGDNLGILGLISAFGSIMGEDTGVELVSGRYAPPDLVERPANLCLIGSRKVNPVAGAMLERLQSGGEPQWIFGPPPGEEEEGDWEVHLYRSQKGERSIVAQRPNRRGPRTVDAMDPAIIVRGPHPNHPGRLVLIMAGPHSLGTGAACLAATRSPLIAQIKTALPPGIDIADKNRTFWVLVRGESSKRDGLLDMEGVSILEAGVYD